MTDVNLLLLLVMPPSITTGALIRQTGVIDGSLCGSTTTPPFPPDQAAAGVHLFRLPILVLATRTNVRK